MLEGRDRRLRDEYGAVCLARLHQRRPGGGLGRPDVDGTRYEPHYLEITQPDQVQIYEAIMVDHAGAVTTGLLSAVRYVKDNRLLPTAFDKATASKEIAVHGTATSDADFGAAGDRVRYVVTVADAQGPYRVEAALWYQPISYRWARNLGARDTDCLIPARASN